jgi:hypothetical protein
MGEWNVWFKQEPNTLAPSTSTMATECFDSEVAAQTFSQSHIRNGTFIKAECPTEKFEILPETAKDWVSDLSPLKD